MIGAGPETAAQALIDRHPAPVVPQVLLSACPFAAHSTIWVISTPAWYQSIPPRDGNVPGGYAGGEFSIMGELLRSSIAISFLAELTSLLYPHVEQAVNGGRVCEVRNNTIV